MMTKSVLIRLLRIFGVVIALNAIAAWVFHPVRTLLFSERLYRYWHDLVPADIVLTGGSRERENIDPAVVDRLLGEKTGRAWKTSNLAIGGVSLEGYHSFLDLLLPKYKQGGLAPPKIFVIGISEVQMNETFRGPAFNKIFEANDDWVPEYDRMQGRRFWKNVFLHGLGPYARARLYHYVYLVMDHVALYRLNGDWAGKERMRIGSRNVLAGFGVGKRIDKPAFEVGPLLVNYKVGEYQLGLLKDLIRRLREAGIRPVLAVLPITDHHTNSYAPYSLTLEQDFVAAIEKLAAEETVPLSIIHKNECGLTDASYFDSCHLFREFRPNLSACFVDEVLLSVVNPSPPEGEAGRGGDSVGSVSP